jgi:hypothetical protein
VGLVLVVEADPVTDEATGLLQVGSAGADRWTNRYLRTQKEQENVMKRAIRSPRSTLGGAILLSGFALTAAELFYARLLLLSSSPDLQPLLTKNSASSTFQVGKG